MGFHLSCSNIRIEYRDGSTYLIATALRENGDENDTEIRLDEFLGNDDGNFQWGGENFTESAEQVTFAIEGGGAVPVLRALLRITEGELRPAYVNLSERIENSNGYLVFRYMY